MLKDKSAAASVAADSPVKVIRKDSSAHIVERDGTVCAALFDEGIVFEGMSVEKVNIPLAYILEDKGDGQFVLSLCEPDMRRPWKLNMNDLEGEEVVAQAKPFETEIVLGGNFDITGDPAGFTLTKSDGKTKLLLTTVHARNYTVRLKKN
jgi:hypothetical protein